MKCFYCCSIDDINELQKISQTTYLEAFKDLLDETNIREYIEIKYSLKNLKSELEDNSTHFLFLNADKKTVGYMKCNSNSLLFEDSLEIERLYIIKEFIGKGFGTEFMKKAESLAKESKKTALSLSVLDVNKPAISFYEKKGFTTRSRGNVYIGRSEYTLLYMKKEL